MIQLDLQFFAGEKTEKATPKKRQDERKKGKVAKSQDINGAVLLLFSFIGLFIFGKALIATFATMFEHTFTEFVLWDLTGHSIKQLFNGIVLEISKVILPIMVIAVIGGIISNLMQIGFLFTTEPLKFDLKKIDPIQGAKRIFSLRAVVELLKSMLKIVFISAITFMVIWIYKDDMLMTAFISVNDAFTFYSKVTAIMFVSAIIALLFLSVFDYAYQRYDYEKNMRMSKQDIKDEYKNIEGDPLIKSKIKEKQRQIATRRMMSEVPNADVVITNPTHIAIAIKYDEKIASAPYVLAKGVDRTALKMKEIANNNQIVMVENKPLARALYPSIEIGDVIPEEFYQAVAEILAYVYSLDSKTSI